MKTGRVWKRSRVNDLFEGDLTDDDQLVYVNNVIKGKLLESQELIVQAANNTKAQFSNSPTLSKEIMNAVMDALTAHTTTRRTLIVCILAFTPREGGCPPCRGEKNIPERIPIFAEGSWLLGTTLSLAIKMPS